MAYSWAADDERRFLLISDIDDTLKRTHRRSSTGMLKKGMRSRNSFAGMAELYNSWVTCGLTDENSRDYALQNRSIIHNTNRHIAYVTGAISKFQWFSCLFLVRSNFPLGAYIGRDKGESFDFKVMAIKKIVEDFQDYELIFIGDNGEDDPAIFELFQRKFDRARPAHFFVHKVYPDEIPEHQSPFLTSLDLAIRFFNQGWIKEDDLARVANAMNDSIHENIRQVLPRWVICPDVAEFWPTLEKQVEPSLHRKIEAIRRLVLRKMATPPAWPRTAAFFEMQ